MQNDPSYDQWQAPSETEEFWIRVTLYKLVYSICGLVIGLACIVVGVMLLLSKLTDSTSGTVGKSELISCVPWAALFIIGLFVIAVTRYSKLSGKQERDMMDRDLRPRLSIHRGPQETVSRRFWKTVNTFALVYSVCGLISGAGLIIGGIVLSLRMITDGTGWSGHIADGVSGITLFGVGLFVITITRYSVKAKDTASA